LYKCIETECIRKELFPLTFTEGIGLIILSIFTGISSSTGYQTYLGIGGGLIGMQILFFILSYDLDIAY
jgi:hypothetical protein